MPPSVHYTLNVCIIGPEFCVFGIIRLFSRKIDWAKGTQEKNEANSIFVLSPIRTHCWFNVLQKVLANSLKNSTCLPQTWTQMEELFFIFWVSGSGLESGSEEPEPWSLTLQTKEPGNTDLRFLSVLVRYQKKVRTG
jgi:hypothetical protein